MQTPPPVPVELKGLAAFAAGMKAPLTGLRFMNRRPELWRHGILPVTCNLLLTAALIIGLFYGARWGFEKLDAWFDPGWGWKILAVLSKIAVVIVAIGLTIAAWILFQGILCGYFYSRLAREVELALGLPAEAMREVPFWYQVADALRDLFWLSLIAIGCFVLNFIPIIGSIGAMIAGAYFNCFTFGLEYLDYPQALRARSWKKQRDFARKHRAATLGLGASALVLSFVPILNAIMLTTAATGAVLLYRQLEPRAGEGANRSD